MKTIKERMNKSETNPYESDYLRMQQIQDLLHITRSTVHKWQKTKGFPKGASIGQRCTLYRKQEVYDWIENHFDNI